MPRSSWCVDMPIVLTYGQYESYFGDKAKWFATAEMLGAKVLEFEGAHCRGSLEDMDEAVKLLKQQHTHLVSPAGLSHSDAMEIDLQ